MERPTAVRGPPGSTTSSVGPTFRPRPTWHLPRHDGSGWHGWVVSWWRRKIPHDHSALFFFKFGSLSRFFYYFFILSYVAVGLKWRRKTEVDGGKCKTGERREKGPLIFLSPQSIYFVFLFHPSSLSLSLSLRLSPETSSPAPSRPPLLSRTERFLSSGLLSVLFPILRVLAGGGGSGGSGHGCCVRGLLDSVGMPHPDHVPCPCGRCVFSLLFLSCESDAASTRPE